MTLQIGYESQVHRHQTSGKRESHSTVARAMPAERYQTFAAVRCPTRFPMTEFGGNRATQAQSPVPINC